MGVSLSYESVDPVPREVAEAIRAELDGPPDGRHWILCEGPHFDTDDGDGHLRGWSKLNLHPHADEWEEASRHPVERDDFRELLRLLCDWSGRFGVDWAVAVEGAPLGRIEGGSCPAKLEGAFAALADVGEYFATEFPEGDDGPSAGPRGLRVWPEPD